MRAYLGIDIGSISTNLVLIDEDNNVIAKIYLSTAGRPIEAVKRGLKEIQGDFDILGVGTTGSGRYMIGDLVGADIVKNEITAQATGAVSADPTVDTIFEIGGQDSKYISLENGVVIDFAMNKVCAAGTGSFLEEQAEKLGINIVKEFAKLAMESNSPALLGDRCTVFIESELNSWLQKGTSKSDLAAGLAEAIVKNYLNKVVENRKVGQNIFFQGGVAFNQAVVKAFEIITGKNITVPQHHEVTGAIGIALIARKEKSWEKSKFRGFDLSQRNYQTESFECKGCENLCEVNKVILEFEKPVFYGGRCERWENGRKKTEIRRQLPNLFEERDKIIFAQEHHKGRKKIGIPRALFFFERFPFWNTFFFNLGYEVVLSSPSNQKIIQYSLENNPVEACFPMMLAHGHILDLLEKEVNYIFLPSMINMEKTSKKFNECFNCPFVQALPYLAKAGIKFPKKTKVLSPALEPQRGEAFFSRQLIKLGKELGKNRKQTLLAIQKAENEYQRIKSLFKKRGEEILKQVEQEKIPALAIISRPYNGSDPVLNLNIPKKLKELGVLAIPIDYLPVKRSDIAHDFPNMYWSYGQKILAAAKFINQHPSLSSVQISNFRCGPDSFISHLIKETISSKPFLQIEVDEHSSDTGVITRLEAFLDSMKNTKTQEARTPLDFSRGKQSTEHRTQNIGIKKRILYFPLMADHTNVLAAALRPSGVETQVLPPPDKKTLELGRKYTSGKECHPFIVTTGDFLKKIMEPGFDPSRSAFFMPSASGPCRFGNYNQTQKILLKKIGYHDIEIVSPDAKDAYGKSMMGFDLKFRRRAWQGGIAVDLLTKLTQETRPHEKNIGEVDKLHNFFLDQICKATESGNGKLLKTMHGMRDAYSAVAMNPNGHKPVIGIVGEIFLRCNPACNANIVKRIEALGGEAWVAPILEWGYYANLGYIYESLMQRRPKHFIMALIQGLFQKRDENRLARTFKGKIKNLHEPSTIKVLKYASPYLHYSYKGEAVLSIGKAIDFIKKGASGIVNILPFTCMPGSVVSALSKQLRNDYGDFPWLDLAIDGNEGVNLETRLEAFMYQAKSYNPANNHTNRNDLSRV